MNIDGMNSDSCFKQDLLSRMICKINFELSPDSPPYETNYELGDNCQNSILKSIDIDIDKFKKFISSQETKDHLKDLTYDAYQKGIFGAPSFVVNNKIFWGQDRLDFVLRECSK